MFMSNNLCAFRGKSTLSKILRLGFSNVLYALWQEQNKRIFQYEKRSERRVTEEIVVNVSNRMLSFSNLENLDDSILRNWYLMEVNVLLTLLLTHVVLE